MKKQLTAVLLIFALLLTMAGCSAANAVQHLDAVEDKVEAKLDAVEDNVEQAVRKAVTPAPAAVPSQPAPTPTEVVPAPAETAPAAAASEPITKEGAEKIALEYLGLARDQVKRLYTEYEIDDGISQYDVQFISGDWEYEFEIHAETGKIMSFDKDHKYD